MLASLRVTVGSAKVNVIIFVPFVDSVNSTGVWKANDNKNKYFIIEFTTFPCPLNVPANGPRPNCPVH